MKVKVKSSQNDRKGEKADTSGGVFYFGNGFRHIYKGLEIKSWENANK